MDTLDRKLMTVIGQLTDSARASKIISINAALLADQILDGRAKNTLALKVVANEIQRLSDESSSGIAALHSILSEVKLLTQTINLAGRQRMLSQKIMKLFLIRRDSASVYIDQEISALTEEFEHSLDRLKLCRLNTTKIGAQLDRASEAWIAFRSALRAGDLVAAVPVNERVLQEMNIAVQCYEELAGARIAVA